MKQNVLKMREMAAGRAGLFFLASVFPSSPKWTTCFPCGNKSNEESACAQLGGRAAANPTAFARRVDGDETGSSRRQTAVTVKLKLLCAFEF